MKNSDLTELTIMKQEIEATKASLVESLNELAARIDRLLPLAAAATRYQALAGIKWKGYLNKAHHDQTKPRRPEAGKSQQRKDSRPCSGQPL